MPIRGLTGSLIWWRVPDLPLSDLSLESEMHIELLFSDGMLFAVLIYGAVALVMSLIRLTPLLNSGNPEQENQLL